MWNEVVKIKRETIAACMTCPLCKNLYKKAITISECLHTFCRKCIYDKITDEDLECCPVCNIDLGCVPLEKLRLDHSKLNLRYIVFPSKRREVKEPEVVAASVALPAKRKERSLSSLVLNTPRVSAQSNSETTISPTQTSTEAKNIQEIENLNASIISSPEKQTESNPELHKEISFEINTETYMEVDSEQIPPSTLVSNANSNIDTTISVMDSAVQQASKIFKEIPSSSITPMSESRNLADSIHQEMAIQHVDTASDIPLPPPTSDPELEKFCNIIVKKVKKLHRLRYSFIKPNEYLAVWESVRNEINKGLENVKSGDLSELSSVSRKSQG